MHIKLEKYAVKRISLIRNTHTYTHLIKLKLFMPNLEYDRIKQDIFL